MITSKNKFVFFHAIGIVFFLCLPILFLNSGSDERTILNIISNSWYWIFVLFYISIFYLHAYWFFPTLYLKNNFIVYFGVLLFLLIAAYFIQPFDHLIHFGTPPNRPPNNFNAGGYQPPQRGITPGTKNIDFVSIFLCFAILAISIIIPVVKQWQQTQQQYFTAQKDKATAELSFLKAQINPHFLFNTLNNIYALALTNSANTADSILRLSNIMRYVTDEVNNDFVLLQNEIECVTDFIALQKLRLNAKTTVVFTYTNINQQLSIAPLILLPFVENVFKHGISNNESSTIEIKITTRGKEIIFYSKNNNFSSTKNNNRLGTGIANVKKRLENLYPTSHFLKVESNEPFFEVHLILNT
jgi:two-component system LytT family sensor kinase